MNKSICFLVGSMSISGGTYVIIQHAAYLERFGYEVTLAVQEVFTAETLAWHDKAPSLRCLPIDEAKSGTYDLVIATWWKTVFELGAFNAGRFGYFVQSIESRFYPVEEAPLRTLVDSTYDFPVHFVTEASWIKQHLLDRHGQQACLVRNGIRKDIYTREGIRHAEKNPQQPRILIEGPFGVPFKNTALAVRLARQAGARDIWVLTSSPVHSLPGVSRVFSRIPMNETPRIYRSCDILIKLSTVEGMFGPPLEMFHCGGTAVVLDVTGHDEYIVHGNNALVASSSRITSIVDAIAQLLNNRDRLMELTSGAQSTARQWPSWDDSSALFSRWVGDCLSGPSQDRAVFIKRSQHVFSIYERDEKARLRTNPSIVRRYKLRAWASSALPKRLTDAIKNLECKTEVLLGTNRVC